MIFKEEIAMTIDENSNLNFEETTLSSLEKECLMLFDRLNSSVSCSEKIIDAKSGFYGFTEKDIQETSSKKLFISIKIRRGVTKKKAIMTNYSKGKRINQSKR